MKPAFFIMAIPISLLIAYPADEAAIKEIDVLLTSWHHAAAVADETVYFGAMAPGLFLSAPTPASAGRRRSSRNGPCPLPAQSRVFACLT